MSIPLFHVDAFTERPFGGDPAAVCILPDPKEDDWLQAVAREMNLSMTAFLVENGGGFDLRWFTPKVEVDLCGHATLASAYVLWQRSFARSGDQILFSTRSGMLKAVRTGGDIHVGAAGFLARPGGPARQPGSGMEGVGRFLFRWTLFAGGYCQGDPLSRFR